MTRTLTRMKFDGLAGVRYAKLVLDVENGYTLYISRDRAAHDSIKYEAFEYGSYERKGGKIFMTAAQYAHERVFKVKRDFNDFPLFRRHLIFVEEKIGSDETYSLKNFNFIDPWSLWWPITKYRHIRFGPRKLLQRTNEKEGRAAFERQDYPTALKLLRPLGEQGNAEAQWQLGWMYEHAQGIPQDDHEAIKWYRKSAEQGYYVAYYSLGIFYRSQSCKEHSYADAYFWFSLWAKQGRAQSLADEMAKHLTLEEKAKEDKLVVQWLKDHPAPSKSWWPF